jgi:predicted nucleic acid-binding protein
VIAVADASPLCYLVLIGEIDLLPQLFSRVLVPQAVILELLHEDAPAAVRAWASNPPGWISAEHTPDVISRGMEKLQAGERAAIFLAESVEADIVIIDEKAARLIAAERGFRLPEYWVYSERPERASCSIWRMRSTGSGEPPFDVLRHFSRRPWSGTARVRLKVSLRPSIIRNESTLITTIAFLSFHELTRR